LFQESLLIDKNSLKAFLITGLLLIFSCGLQISLGQTGAIRGHIQSPAGQPLAGVELEIFCKAVNLTYHSKSDKSGNFGAAGLSRGRYSLRFTKPGFKAHTEKPLILEHDRCLLLEVTLAEASIEAPSRARVVKLDPTRVSHGTSLSRSHIQGLPLAHNVWSLIENLDLSATTNRIDVGGLWSGIPALFSARGGGSWTQSLYALNGMDITDPYDPGRLLLYPDFYALSSVLHTNAGHPASFLLPGGHFNLITSRGSDDFKGAVSAFYISHSLQADNVNPKLEEEGLFESHKFNYMLDGNVQISGPVIPGKLTFFTSVSAFDLSRNVAEYQEDDLSKLLSGLVELDYRFAGGLLQILWTGQRVDHPSWGAGRDVPFSVTSDRKERFDLFQSIWSTRLNPRHHLRAGLNYVRGRIQSDFQEEIPGPYGREIFQLTPQGTAPWASLDKRRSLSLQLEGDALFGGLLEAQHRLQYGLKLLSASASSQTEVYENLHLHFYNGDALEVVRYNTPLEQDGNAWHLSFYAQDSLTFGDFFTILAGLNFTASQGSSPGNDNKVRWLNLAPRLGIIIPLSASRHSCFKIAYARYYFTLPLSYLTYGSTDAQGALVYAWSDLNNDKAFQEQEQGDLLRREGPYYGSLDPKVKRPATDEISLSYQTVFGSGWNFFLGGFYRRTHNLIRTLNVGVPFGAYSPEHFVDRGDDDILYTHDDQIFTVYNQNPESLGQDHFLLSNLNPDARTSLYFGLDLNLVKKFGDRFTFLLSLTATQAEGETNPGNTEYENDDGVLGHFLDNPNTLINSRGRVRFDRAYTGRIGIDYLGPWDIRLGCVVKYYDGQPFSRKIIIDGMNQGPYYIQAHPRGRMRYEYNRTVDIRIEKMFPLTNTHLRIILDAFNLLNRALATEESPWSGPNFQARYATEIQSPRVFRLGLVFEF
jgi:hypothetical protein